MSKSLCTSKSHSNVMGEWRMRKAAGLLQRQHKGGILLDLLREMMKKELGCKAKLVDGEHLPAVQWFKPSVTIMIHDHELWVFNK